MPESRTWTAERLTPLAAPAYFVALLLVLIPMGDFLSGIWPWRFGALDWRFASSGLLSGFLMTPLLGFLIAISLAAARGSEGLMRTLGVLLVIGASLLTLILAAFVMDALQLNASMPAEQKRAFLDATIKAVFKFLLGVTAAFWLGIRAMRANAAAQASRAGTAQRTTIVLGAEEASR